MGAVFLFFGTDRREALTQKKTTFHRPGEVAVAGSIEVTRCNAAGRPGHRGPASVIR